MNCHTVIQAGVFAQPIESTNGPGLGIVAPVNKPRNTGVNDRPRAHRTGLECHKKRAIQQAPMPKGSARLSHRDDLGMCGWIMIGLPAVIPLTDNALGRIVHNDAADRHFAELLGLSSKLQRGLHVREGHGKLPVPQHLIYATGTTRVTSGTFSRRLRSMPI